MNALQTLPIVVIGAGPVGLAAAAHLATRKLSFLVLEASDGVAASFKSTAHVRLFSPMKMNIDAAAARVLEAQGWHAPDPESMPTAGALRALYLEPLAAALQPNVRYGTQVQGISRRGFDKLKTLGRERAPFVVRFRANGGEEELEARAVIDASGTWSSPNWMGANGLPAIGEREHRDRIQYGMPDVAGTERIRYAEKRVLVVGSGHSAVGTLIALSELAQQAERTSLVWAIRGDNLTRIFGGAAQDGLPERGKLGIMLRKLIESRQLELHKSFEIEVVTKRDGRLEVSGRLQTQAHSISALDEVVVATGTRPDLSLARELRLHMDAWLESTEQLAPLIDPNEHSCGTVPPHGHRELMHPEPGYYAVGAKSYGRAPNFLMATGYEQVRSVVAALAGDMAAADDVQLVLPETGVCRTDFAAAGEAGGCASAAEASATSGCCPVGSGPKVAKTTCCG